MWSSILTFILGRNFKAFYARVYSEAEFLVILCTYIQPHVLSPEVDLRPRPSLHTHTVHNRDRE
jgi:hypothetical protein